MAVRVRLTRVGSKKNAIWRVVVTDRRSPRDGRFIEMIGHYNPQTQPSRIVIDRERLQHWLDRGAQPTNTVKKLMRAQDTGGGAAAAAPAADTPATPAETAEAPAETAEPGPAADAPEAQAEASAEDEPPEPAEAAAGDVEEAPATDAEEAVADEPAAAGDAENE